MNQETKGAEPPAKKWCGDYLNAGECPACQKCVPSVERIRNICCERKPIKMVEYGRQAKKILTLRAEFTDDAQTEAQLTIFEEMDKNAICLSFFAKSARRNVNQAIRTGCTACIIGM